MDLQFSPHIPSLTHITMEDKPPPGYLHWPDIQWKSVSHGDNHIRTQRLTGEFFRAMRIHISLATPTRLTPVARQPTVAIAFLHQGQAWGKLSGIREMIEFCAGYYYITLLLPGSSQGSIIELEAGHHEATVIMIEKEYEAVFLKMFPYLAPDMQRILSLRSSGLPYPPQPITPAISELLHSITHYDGPADSLHFTITLTVSALIIALQRQQEERLTTSTDAYRIHAYLISQLGEPLTAGKVATKLKMSRKRLNGVMKQHFKKTFKDYLTLLRMERAKELLSETNEPVNNIGDMLGYRSIAHFSNAFLKSEGLRPSEYRKSKR